MEDEISIKDIVLMLWKEKKLIRVISSIVIVCGVVFAFIKPREYEARLTLMTNALIQPNEVDTSAGVYGIVETTHNPFPQTDVLTYQAQFLNPEVLNNTIRELDLSKNDGTPMTQETLREEVGVSIPENTNILVVTVRNKDPELAAQIANTLGDQFITFITKKSRESADSIAENLDINLADEKIKLDEEAARWRDYVLQLGNIDILKNEVATLVSQITSYKAELNIANKDAVIYANSLNVLLNGKNTVTALDIGMLELSISGSSQGSYSVQINNQNELQTSLLTIEAVHLETALVKVLERIKVLETEIVTLENRLSELQAKLVQEQYQYDSIIRDYNLAQSAYAAYQTRAKEIKIAAMADMGRISIQISSPAVVPTESVSMSRTIIIIIAAMAGVVLAVLAAFLKESWNNSEPRSSKNVSSKEADTQEEINNP